MVKARHSRLSEEKWARVSLVCRDDVHDSEALQRVLGLGAARKKPTGACGRRIFRRWRGVSGSPVGSPAGFRDGARRGDGGVDG